MDLKKANLVRQMIVFLMLVFLLTSSIGSTVIGSTSVEFSKENEQLVGINNNQNNLKAQGGPDGWGYSWVNSTGSPSVPYGWQSVNGSWTDLGLESDDWSKVDLDFNFTFYGIEYDSTYIMSNGWLSFTDVAWYQSDDFPAFEGLNCIISPYSADLNLSTGSVYYYANSSQFMVTWDNVNDTGTSNYQTFQVILNKTGEIWFNYDTVSSPAGNVGIENQNSTIGLDYDSVASLSSGLSIRFNYTLPMNRIMLNPDPVVGYGDKGETVWRELTVNNRGSNSGTYLFDIEDPFWNSSVYDSVGGDELSFLNVDLDSAKTVYIKLDIPNYNADLNSTTIKVSKSGDSTVNKTCSLVGAVAEPILLVDSDGGASTEDYYYQALEGNNYGYNYWDYSKYGTPSIDILESFRVVIWFTGGKWNSNPEPLTGNDRAVIGDYIDSGGEFYISSAQSGYATQDDRWYSWIERYMMAEWEGKYPMDAAYIQGIPGDPLSDGLNFSYLMGDADTIGYYYDSMPPVGNGAKIFENTTNNWNLGVRGEIGEARIVFTPFEFASVNEGNENNRTILMDRILTWLVGPPNEPSQPYPSNGQEHVSQDVTLSVNITDPQEDDVDVTFFNGTGSVLGTAYGVSNGSRAQVQWSGLEPNTTYSWYVEARDGCLINKSSTWTFKTQLPPNAPSSPQPANNSKHISVNPTLSVYVEDAENSSLTVNFYDASDDSIIGVSSNIGNNITNNGTASITWSGLSTHTIYEWYCIVSDGNTSTRSENWSFRTQQPPRLAFNPKPIDNSTDISLSAPVTLKVNVTDPDGDNMDVSFYDASDDSLIGTDTNVANDSTSSIDWTNLNSGTKYEWYVVAYDGELIRTSETWSFITNYEPRRPGYPSPYHKKIGVSLSPTLSVKVEDPDGDAMDVTFYDASDDTVLGSKSSIESGSTASIEWSGLSIGTTYSWYVVADDGEENRTSVLWEFTTLQTPNEPNNPSPLDGATGISTSVELRVFVSDIEGENMDVSFYDASDDTLIDNVSDVRNGSFVSVMWTELNHGETYEWYVTAEDNAGLTESPTWSFTTSGGTSNTVPDNPMNPFPSDGSTDISTSPTISVEVSDPDDDSMDVSFYDASDDTLIGTDTGVSSGSTASTSWTGLSTETTYSWYAVADDASESVNSTTYSFSTRGPNTAPDEPTTPSPSDGSTDVSTSPTISVEVSDPDDDSMDVSFYDASDDTLIGTDTGVSSGSMASTSWSGLSANTSYEWYAVADDGIDESSKSSTWSFKTEVTDTSDQTPPSIEESNPADGAKDVDINGDITITLDEPVVSETIDISVTYDGEEISGDYSISNDGTVITFTPDNKLDKGKEYTVNIIAEDSSGNEIDQGFSFTTSKADNTGGENEGGFPIWAIGIVLIIVVLVIAYFIYNRNEEEEETIEDDLFSNTGSQETAADFFAKDEDKEEVEDISEEEYESEEDLFEDSEESIEQEDEDIV